MPNNREFDDQQIGQPDSDGKRERRMEITLRTERSISVKSSRALTALCQECRREVQMFTPGQAALLSGLSSREVYHRVERGEVHFTETVEGLLLVCFDSLLGYSAAQGELLIEAADADISSPDSDATNEKLMAD